MDDSKTIARKPPRRAARSALPQDLRRSSACWRPAWSRPCPGCSGPLPAGVGSSAWSMLQLAPGSVELGGLGLSWTGPIELAGVTLLDPKGKIVLAATA